MDNITLDYPLVSIITPSLDSHIYIEKTIQSIITQDYPNIEYIIIDGGSTDGTLDIIQKFEPLLSHWISERDSGQAEAINKGFNKSKGDIIAWINADDIYQPCAVGIAVEALIKNPKVMMIYSDCDLIDERGDLIGQFPSEPFDIEKLFLSNFIPQQTVFLRREVVDRVGLLNPDYHYVMDYDWWLRIGLRENLLRIPDQKLASFRLPQHSKSMSQTIKFYDETLLMIESLLENNSIFSRNTRDRIKNRHQLRAGLRYLRSGDLNKSRSLLLKAFSSEFASYPTLIELSEKIIYDMSHQWGLPLIDINIEEMIQYFFKVIPWVSWKRDLVYEIYRVLSWQAYNENDRKNFFKYGIRSLSFTNINRKQLIFLKTLLKSMLRPQNL